MQERLTYFSRFDTSPVYKKPKHLSRYVTLPERIAKDFPDEKFIHSLNAALSHENVEPIHHIHKLSYFKNGDIYVLYHRDEPIAMLCKYVSFGDLVDDHYAATLNKFISACKDQEKTPIYLRFSNSPDDFGFMYSLCGKKY